MKKVILGLFCLISISTSYALDGRSKAYCYNTKGTERHDIQVNSLHQTHFFNDSDQNQTITITYKLCAQFMPCKIENNIYLIPPHTEWNDSKRLGIMMSYTRRGRYKASATTRITGAIIRQEISRAKIEIEP